MGDFHQHGIITALHQLNTRPLEDLESDLCAFRKSGPMGLILPSLYSELEKPALATIVDELCRVPYLFDHHTEFTCTGADGETFSGIYHCHGHFNQNYHRVADLLSKKELRQGKVGQAWTYLIDAVALWRKVEEVLRNDPTFFTRGAQWDR